MQIRVGSKNPNKLHAVKVAMLAFDMFTGAEFKGVSADSGVSDQPLGFEEMLTGAQNRATRAFNDCRFSVGLESGLIPVPLTKSGHMNLTACVIYNGVDMFAGLGPAFELPEGITRGVVDEHLELDEAIFKSGISDNPRIGYSEGIIGILTGGVVTRKDYMIPAVSMALARLMPQCFK